MYATRPRHLPLLFAVGLACLAVVALGSLAAAHAASPVATTSLVNADSPAPDGGDQPSEGASSDPTQEPTTEPTTAPTQAAPPSAAAGGSGTANTSKHSSSDHGSSSNSKSDSSADRSSAGTGSVSNFGPTDTPTDKSDSTPAEDSTAPTGKDRDSMSTVGWVLLIGGLASAIGAAVIYRRNPGLISWPWPGHAH